MNTYLYSIVRYVPDPVRGEQMNIGVAVASQEEGFFGSKFLSPRETSRLRRIGAIEAFGFIKELAEQMRVGSVPSLLKDPSRPAWNADALRHAALEWANTVQLSPPRPVLHERGEALVDTLYARYVSSPRPQRQRARDRRWVKSRVTKSLRQALITARPDIDVEAVLLRDELITGELEQHRFDYGLANGQLRRLVQTLSLEGVDRAAVKTELDALAWAIDDVRKVSSAVPINIVTIGSGRLLETAERVYGGLDATVVREPAIEDWANTAALDVATALDH